MPPLNLNARALHYLFKIGDRPENIKFFRDVLGMKVLRHDELPQGSPALCNGPYPGAWSKTMVGYGSEDTHFLLELIHNYDVPSYEVGNDLCGIFVNSPTPIANAKKLNWPMQQEDGFTVLKSPDGYTFYISDESGFECRDPLYKVVVTCSNLDNSMKYYRDVLEMKVYSKENNCASFGFDDNQCKLVLQEIGCKVEHKTGYGRMIYSIPFFQLKPLEARIKETGHKILVPLVELGTPGKATVTVQILHDPDEHELSFVEDEGFRALSRYNPRSNDELEESMRKMTKTCKK